MSSWDDMLSGKPFSCADPEIEAAADRCREVLFDFNHTRDREAAVAQLRSLFGRTGQSFWVETGFHCDYGCNISVGERFYANAGCVILDECPVTFGRDCMLGPHVGIYTATHPIEGAQRRNRFHISVVCLLAQAGRLDRKAAFDAGNILYQLARLPFETERAKQFGSDTLRLVLGQQGGGVALLL